MLRAVPPAPLALERRRGRRGQQLGGSVRVVVARGAHASLRAEMLCAARMVVSVATRAVEAAAVGGHDATPVPASPLPAGLSQHSLPNHLAVIMDGNARWAQQQGLPVLRGYEEGVVALRSLVSNCCQWGIPALTVFAFSVDNWQRPAAEVRILLELMARVLQTELPQLQRAGVRLHVLGDLSRLPASFRAQLQRAVEATAGNSTLQLSVAISYSGRASLVVAARSLAAAAAAGELDAACIDAAAVAAALGTAHLPPQLREPDLLVRTSGERRLSDFLLWELAYTELYFTHVHWPAFGAAELAAALQDYAGRSRRFGTH